MFGSAAKIKSPLLRLSSFVCFSFGRRHPLKHATPVGPIQTIESDSEVANCSTRWPTLTQTQTSEQKRESLARQTRRTRRFLLSAKAGQARREFENFRQQPGSKAGDDTQRWIVGVVTKWGLFFRAAHPLILSAGASQLVSK